jgi:hypothetical protein
MYHGFYFWAFWILLGLSGGLVVGVGLAIPLLNEDASKRYQDATARYQDAATEYQKATKKYEEASDYFNQHIPNGEMENR